MSRKNVSVNYLVKSIKDLLESMLLVLIAFHENHHRQHPLNVFFQAPTVAISDIWSSLSFLLCVSLTSSFKFFFFFFTALSPVTFSNTTVQCKLPNNFLFTTFYKAWCKRKVSLGLFYLERSDKQYIVWDI